MASLIRGVLSPVGNGSLGKGDACSSTQGIKRRRFPSLGLLSIPCAKRQRCALAASPQVRTVSGIDKPVEVALRVPFSALAHGPYLDVASWLDETTLASTDVASRWLKDLNSQPFGPWQMLGSAAFFGMELRTAGGEFSAFEGVTRGMIERGHGWNHRYRLFRTQTRMFDCGRRWLEDDCEFFCFSCYLRTDMLEHRADHGVYIEVEIHAHADIMVMSALILGLWDDDGEDGNVAFDPEKGTVLRQRKGFSGTEEIQLLPEAPPGQDFEGVIGLYLQNGHLAFYRRWYAQPPSVGRASNSLAIGPDPDMMPAAGSTIPSNSPAIGQAIEPAWETTGFCNDLSWASGKRLLVRLFCDKGAHNVQISKVGGSPPIAT